MYFEWETSELCSTVDPNHKHNTQTQHDFLTGGETTWQTVLRRFADPAAVDRWTLRSPVERGQIVPGPDAAAGQLGQVAHRQHQHRARARRSTCGSAMATASRSGEPW